MNLFNNKEVKLKHKLYTLPVHFTDGSASLLAVFIVLILLIPLSLKFDPLRFQYDKARGASFTSSQTGDWNIGTTWGGICASSCSAGTDYPGTTDDATIGSGHTITTTQDEAVDNITIDGGTLTVGSGNNLTIDGDWTYNSGTVGSTTGAVTFDASGATQTITTGNQWFPDFNFGGDTKVYVVDGDLKVNIDLYSVSGTSDCDTYLDLETNNSDLYVAGTLELENGGAILQSGNNTTYLTESSLTEGASPFNNDDAKIRMSTNSSCRSLHNVVFQDTSDWTDVKDLQPSGTITIDSSVDVLYEGSGERFFVYSDLTINGNLDYNSGQRNIRFASTTGTTKITTNGNVMPRTVFGTDGVNGGIYQLQDDYNVATGDTNTDRESIDIIGGTLDTNGFDIDIQEGTFSNTGGTFTPTFGTTTISASTCDLAGCDSNDITVTGTTTFHNFVMDHTLGTNSDDYYFSGGVTINNNLFIEDGYLHPHTTEELRVGGNLYTSSAGLASIDTRPFVMVGGNDAILTNNSLQGYGSITIRKDPGATVELGSPLLVQSYASTTSGILDMNGRAFSVWAGNFYNGPDMVWKYDELDNNERLKFQKLFFVESTKNLWDYSSSSLPNIEVGDNQTLKLQTNATSSSVRFQSGAHDLDLNGYNLTLLNHATDTPLVQGSTDGGVSVLSNGNGRLNFRGTVSTQNISEGIRGAINTHVTFSSTNTVSFILGSDWDGYSIIVEDGNTLDANGYTINNAGAEWTNRGTFLHGSSTVTFDRNGTGSDPPITTGGSPFYNVTFAGSNAPEYLLQDSLFASGTITVTTGKLDANGNRIVIDGDFSNSDTLTFESSTLVFSTTTGTSNLTSGGYAVGNIEINDNGGSGTLQLQDQLNASGTISITGGTLDANGQNIIFDDNWTNSDTFTHGGGTVIFASTTDTTLLTSGGSPFSAFIMNDNGGSATLQLQDNFNASGTVTIVGGTLDSNGQNIILDGNWTNNDTFTHGGGTITFSTSSATQNITTNSSPLNNVVINDNGGSGTISIQDLLHASGSITITGGTLDSNSNDIILDGNWTNTDTFTAGSATTTFASSSAQSITSGSSSFYNLAHTGLGTTTISDTTTIGGNLRISLGGLLINALTTVTGDIENSGVIEEATSYIAKDAVSLSLDKSTYDADSDTELTITLIDHDENLSGFATNTASTTVSLTTGADSETVTLTETGLATRIFTGTLSIDGDASPTTDDGTLQIDESTDTITVSYTDNEDGSDNSASDTATISATIAPPASSGDTSSGGGGGGVAFFQYEEPTTIDTITRITDKITDKIGNVRDRVIDRIRPIIPPFLIPDKTPDEVVILPECNVYNCGWNYINPATLGEFVLAPLPEDLKILAGKFPELKTTLGRIGVDRLGRLEQLIGSDITLPGIQTVQELDNILDSELSFEEGKKLSQIKDIVGGEFILGNVKTFEDLEDITGITFDIEGISSLEDLEIALNVDLRVLTVDELEQIQLLSGVSFSLPKILTLRNLDVNTFEEINKLTSVDFALPVIRELKDIPTEIVFARAGSNLIDFNLALDVASTGEISQRITGVSGQPLNLAVKPEYAVDSIVGHLVLKESAFSQREQTIPGAALTSSLIFSTPDIGNKITQAPIIEERLLLETFTYSDSDNDGIYTADITAPLVSGTFEIITIMDYTDPDRGLKELRLVLVIDPEGYVYEKVSGGELRISGAQVSIFEKAGDGEFELWPANRFQQKNPQITENSGEYSFLVPEGEYYVTVEADGYQPYKSETFTVIEGRGVHINIEMKMKGFDIRSINIVWVALIVLALLSLYNFYRGRRRSRVNKV